MRGPLLVVSLFFSKWLIWAVLPGSAQTSALPHDLFSFLSYSCQNNCSLFLLYSLAQEPSLIFCFSFLGFPLQMLEQGCKDTEISLSQSQGLKRQDLGEDGLLSLLCPYPVVSLCVAVS